MNPISYLVDNMMMPFLNFSYQNLYPNYGIAILLLTFVIKIVFYPLTKKQFVAMKQNQKVQPELQKIREKYKKEPEKLQKEMMRLWKENGVNPFSGCVPTLIQLPFFFAVFYTVNSQAFKDTLAAPEINPGLFNFWLSDLSMPDTTFILPIIIGLSTYFTQKLMVTDPKQKAIMMFLPFLMVVICLKMPSGVLLYWATSQVVSFGQQYLILKKAD